MEAIESVPNSIDFELDLRSSIPSVQSRLRRKTHNTTNDYRGSTTTPVASTNDVQYALDDARPHATIVKDAFKWKIEMESMRDEMYMVSVKNAILLDRYAMMLGNQETFETP